MQLNHFRWLDYHPLKLVIYFLYYQQKMYQNSKCSEEYIHTDVIKGLKVENSAIENI